MPLNIKNNKAEELARIVARETGETITQTIIHSLEERLQRLRGKKKSPDIFETIMEISHRCRSLPDLDQRTPDEILNYNEAGAFRPW